MLIFFNQLQFYIFSRPLLISLMWLVANDISILNCSALGGTGRIDLVIVLVIDWMGRQDIRYVDGVEPVISGLCHLLFWFLIRVRRHFIWTIIMCLLKHHTLIIYLEIIMIIIIFPIYDV